MDQYSWQFTPAHFIRRVDASFVGKPVFSADVDFLISENPNFRFYFLPKGPGPLKVTASDSQNREFAHVEALRGTTP